MTGTIRFARILARTDQIAAQLHGLQFSSFHPPDATWQPAVNVYAYTGHLAVCVELAGVRKQDITVDVEARRLVVRGHRVLPDSGCEDESCGRLLVMEIADGSFERTLEFPVEIDAGRVEARQENGWLWIVLPKAHRGRAL